MNDILQELDVAFKAISGISVSGDAVDAMAVARAKLRNVYAKLKDIEAVNTSEPEKEV